MQPQWQLVLNGFRVRLGLALFLPKRNKTQSQLGTKSTVAESDAALRGDPHIIYNLIPSGLLSVRPTLRNRMTSYSLLAGNPSSGESSPLDSPISLPGDSTFSNAPISDTELDADADSPWEDPVLGPAPSEYEYSSEGEPTDLTSDDGNVYYPSANR